MSIVRYYVQGFLFWLATQQELRWWLNRARKELTDDPEERAHIIKLFASMGINGAVAFVLMSHLVFSTPVGDAPVLSDVLPATGDTKVTYQLQAPASPIDPPGGIEQLLTQTACFAQTVEKTQVNANGGAPIYTFTAIQTNQAGGSVFLRWTDAPGSLGAATTLEVNKQAAHPAPVEPMKKCLRERAVLVQQGGPR